MHPVLIFSVLLSVVTGILFGFVPALQASGGNFERSVERRLARDFEGRGRGKLRALLVIAEMAVALILMTGAGLLMQSFSRLMKVNPGFSSKQPDDIPDQSSRGTLRATRSSKTVLPGS